MAYGITDDMFERKVLTEGDVKVLVASGEDAEQYPVGEELGSKHTSVAAFIAWVWSLDGNGATSGDAQYGNGHHVLFADERVILHEDSQGEVDAWRIPADENLAEVWEEIERGAVYPDQCNNPDCDDLSCENFDCGQEV
jgi:hypothetical protein